ncbi:MAG TPA: hypothetical protein PLC15_05250 [Candidatus Obscuribacter sp.]|nr:hypothetical protein [Candidatus Obscuribacter sp.]MBK9276634.1 hypothetical protein [Candidatus Obscuribacter sp.]HMY51451.1 hypothetical protein [Candidatus Obscuribacter sp.]HNB14761.1 hypothetical protein [Candidatus Obscuribacter sp.]HND65824.1 hypothetical protein [Candidatus Obscuribacter sp.]
MSEHIIFMIHGITDGSNVERDFESLKKLLQPKLRRDSKNFKLVGINWSPSTISGKSVIYNRCFGKIEAGDRALVDATLYPMQLNPHLLGSVFHIPSPFCLLKSHWHAWRGWRYFSTLFVGDIIAYTDENDNGIRRSVWKQMYEELSGYGDQLPEVSIIGHSLGSVIAYDFVWALLGEEKPRIFSMGSDEGDKVGEDWLLKLRDTYRNLITVGSPVGLFLMRNKKFWDSSMQSDDRSVIRNLKNPLTKGKHKWLNIFDTDDFVGYPLAPLFSSAENADTAAAPVDLEVESNWFPPVSHVNYWKNGKTASLIANAF